MTHKRANFSRNKVDFTTTKLPLPFGKLVACDTETTGLNAWKGDRPFAFSFCNPEAETKYIRWKVDPFKREVWPVEKDFFTMKKFFGDSTITKVFHNAKFDVRMLEKSGIPVRGTVHDTMIAMHVLRTDEETLALKPICAKYVGITDEDEKELHKAVQKARREGKKKGWKIATDEDHGKEPAKADYWLAPPEICERYATIDAVRAMALWMLLEEKLKEEGLWEIYLEEMQLFWVVYRMESRGVRVDPKRIDEEIVRNKKIVAESFYKIQHIKKGINVNSPQQLVKYFHGEKKLPVLKYTCKCIPGMWCRRDNHGERPSYGTEVLTKLEDPLARLIIEYKTAEKAVNGFFGRFKKLMVEEDGLQILHPTFQQCGTVTGRFSCKDPNFQNVADPYGTRAPIPIPARRVFRPRPDYVWYHYDYKQMELWLFSSPKIANELKMLNVLLSGEDLPSAVAIEMGYGKNLEEDKRTNRGVTRIRMKLMLYGIVYGIGEGGLALLNKISYDESKRDLAMFKARYPNIDQYMERTIQKAKHYGFVDSPLGRRFRTDRSAAYKSANYIVQGSAAQILKRAMIDTDAWLCKNKIDGHLILTIHDELAFEIHKRYETFFVINGLKKIMESYGKLFEIPKLPTDVERVRENWMDKELMDL